MHCGHAVEETPRRAAVWRLFPRLLLTQTLPLGIVVVAVALVFVSTTRVTSMLAELRDTELSALAVEADLHRAGWALDVSMRHAGHACRDGGSDRAATVSEVRRAAQELRVALASSTSADPEMARVCGAYLVLAEEVASGRECSVLSTADFDARRAVLDEELTNAWVGRMSRLHEAVIARDREAHEAGAAGLAGGVVLVLVGLALALAVSLAFARSVTAPLVHLAGTARRLGRGQFDDPVETIAGPTELIEFAQELEIMRRRLAELDALKQQFVASVSHEMRTPLSKMREALALLADGAAGELQPRQQRVVRIARDACERQIRTVTSMLDLSRLRAGSPLRMREQTSLDGAVREAVDDERADAVSAGVTVDLVFRPEENVKARIDDVLLERAVANLVRNAVGVSNRGQRVEVTREVLDRGPDGRAGKWVCVRVRDEGPGIPAELEQTILQPFVSHDVARSPKRVGVGLGLALASEVARAHGGSLEIVRPERGAELGLWIPLARDVVPSAATASQEEST
jgi:two-component system sensor histidine kinase GlrK